MSSAFIASTISTPIPTSKTKLKITTKKLQDIVILGHAPSAIFFSIIAIDTLYVNKPL